MTEGSILQEDIKTLTCGNRTTEPQKREARRTELQGEIDKFTPGVGSLQHAALGNWCAEPVNNHKEIAVLHSTVNQFDRVDMERKWLLVGV